MFFLLAPFQQVDSAEFICMQFFLKVYIFLGEKRSFVMKLSGKTLVPPKWIVEPEDRSVILGNSVVIPCEAIGSPPPTFLWKQAIGNRMVTHEYMKHRFTPQLTQI